jgi:hypothetical protein
MNKFIPAWKDKNGNRLLILAENHVFDDWDSAFHYQAGDFIFYIPYGLTPAGIVEMDLEDGKGDIPHVLCDMPHGALAAVISGPIFDNANSEEHILKEPL